MAGETFSISAYTRSSGGTLMETRTCFSLTEMRQVMSAAWIPSGWCRPSMIVRRECDGAFVTGRCSCGMKIRNAKGKHAN